MQQHRFRSMGCEMLAALDAPCPPLAVEGWFAAWERQLSRFLPESDLSRLNRHGALTGAGEALWQALQVALDAADWSDGLVVPTLLAALETAGYDRSFERIADNRPARPGAVRPAADWRAIVCDPASRNIRLPRGARLDLGGVAKGWAADTAAGMLGAAAPALIDAGGDIAISGRRRDGSDWPVSIADPLCRQEHLGLLRISKGGVATSGRDHRRWLRNGRWQHHIIDPRSGQPALTDLLSVTVVGPSAACAEVAAKVVLILGSQAGLDWLEQRPEFAALLVHEDGRQSHSSGLEAYLW